MLAAALALSAGAAFGVSAHIQRAALGGMDVRRGTVISVGTMAVLAWLAAPFVLDRAWWGTQAALIFAICGLLFPAASQTLQIVSVQRVGPALSAALGSVAPVFAIIPAVLILGETLNFQGAVGLSIVLAGLILSALGARPGAARQIAFWMLLIPIGASAARGIVQPALKFGLAEVPSPFFATLVMLTVSSAVVSLRLLRPDRSAKPPSRRGAALFALNGAVTGFGILLLNLAIGMGEVTLAAPLASTAPLWALVFGVVFFRTERIGLRQILLSTLVVIGVALIVTR